MIDSSALLVIKSDRNLDTTAPMLDDNYVNSGSK